jgi:hypothetical protein
MSVRPPAPVEVTDAQLAFIAYDPAAADGESLVARIIAAADWPTARQLAENAIGQATASLDFQGVEHAAGLIALRHAIAARLRDAGGPEDVESTVGAPLGTVVSQPAFKTAKAALLDLYAAPSLLPAVEPEQREQALLSLRTLHTLERLAANRSLLARPALLARVLRARVVLPAALMQKAAGAPTPTPASPAAPSPDLPDAPFYTLANFERLRTLAAVQEELQWARRRNRELLTVPPPGSPAPDAPGAPSPAPRRPRRTGLERPPSDRPVEPATR